MVYSLRSLARTLVSSELLVVPLAVVASIALRSLMLPAVVIAVLYWPLRRIAWGRWSVRTPADYPIAGLVLLLPMTLWVTNVPATTIDQVLRLLTGIALYYALVNGTRTLRQVRVLFVGAYLCGLALVGIAPFTVLWKPGKLTIIPPALYRSFQLLVSDAINPSVLAGVLVLLLPYMIAVLLWEQLRLLHRILLASACVLMLGTVLLSQSRGGWIGLAAGLSLMILLRWRRGWLLLLAPFAAAIVAVGVIGIGHTTDILTTDRTFGGIGGREQVWTRAILLIRDFPITGIGMGTFQQMSGALYPFENPLWQIPHAHDIFLTIAVDLGIPGLIAWLAVIFLIIASGWQLYRRGSALGESAWMALGVGTICSQVTLMVHGITDAVTWGMVRPAVLVWALWGLSIAAWRIAVPISATAASEVTGAAQEATSPMAEGKSKPSRTRVLTLSRKRP